MSGLYLYEYSCNCIRILDVVNDFLLIDLVQINSNKRRQDY